MRWRAGLAIGLVTVALGSPIHAEHGRPHGYCDSNNKPVVLEWPAGYEQATPICRAGTFSVLWTTDHPSYQELARPEIPVPEDWGGWVTILLNDEVVINPYGDVLPYLVRSTGRTLVPIRYVSEAIGAKVTWEGSAKGIRLEHSGRTTEMTVGSRSARINGKVITLDQPPLLWRDRTMVPLRVIAEAFGAGVEWHGTSSSVLISLPGAACPPSYCP